ncbi:hypothetical protein [Nocardia amikacinitolerans]|uniref:hypothetical protein n=1 Tax=Nocardia amikacinitolerans TaxID=756689 RepID=UPI0012ECF758|nr:hypothetical protein [Nocardia amikacinitolerans]
MALPVAAVWLTCPPLAAASPAPPLPPPGIITGSAAGGPSTGIESPPTAAPLALGPKLAPVPRGSGGAGGDAPDGSGNAVPFAGAPLSVPEVATGSAGGTSPLGGHPAAGPDQPLVPLSLGARDTSAGGAPIGSGSAAAGAAPRTNSGSTLTDLTAIDTGSAYAAIPLALAPEGSPMRESSTVAGAPGYEPVPVANTDSALEPAATTPAETLGLDVGSVRTACAGSAAAGSAALALGSAAPALGSGLVGPGSSGSALGSGLVGPGLLGSGSALGSGLVGPGSSGSALGSAAGSALGSALGGSALLTCLLLLPTTPPTPGIPLRLEPPLPIPIPQAAPEPVPAQALTPAPVPPPLPARPPEAADPQPVEPTADPLAWNLLELMTVLVITVLAAVRTRVVATRAPRLP